MNTFNKLLPALPIFYLAGSGMYDLYRGRTYQYSDNLVICNLFKMIISI